MSLPDFSENAAVLPEMLPEMRGGGVSFDSPVRGPALSETRVERAERSRSDHGSPLSRLSRIDADELAAFLRSRES